MTEEVSKKSLLVVSHTYAVNPHALKLVALGEHFDVTCVTVSREDAGFEEARLGDHRLATFRTVLHCLGAVAKLAYVSCGLN